MSQGNTEESGQTSGRNVNNPFRKACWWLAAFVQMVQSNHQFKIPHFRRFEATIPSPVSQINNFHLSQIQLQAIKSGAQMHRTTEPSVFKVHQCQPVVRLSFIVTSLQQHKRVKHKIFIVTSWLQIFKTFKQKTTLVQIVCVQFPL